MKIVKKIWKIFVNKYKQKFVTIKRQYLQKFINYKKFSNVIIEIVYIDIIKKKLIKNFNDDNLFMRIKQNVEIFRTFVQKNVYIINKIILKFKKFALLTNNMMFVIKFFEILFISFAISTIVNLNKILFDANIDFRNNVEIDFQSSNVDSNVDSNVNQKKRDLYELWYRRFDYMKFAKFRNLHKITILRKSILIVENRNDSCKIYAITKMINTYNRRLIERKIHILKLIFIDICEFLFVSKFDYEYFLKIVNNHFRRTWILFFRKRIDASKIFNKWKLKIKLKTQRKLQTIRCNNVKKLKFIFNFWCEFIDIVLQYIVFYNFIQNDVIKRVIKIIENRIRTMI